MNNQEKNLLYVLDTHVLIWYFIGSKRLHTKLGEKIDTIRNQGGCLLVPTIVLAEALDIAEKGRVEFHFSEMYRLIKKESLMVEMMKSMHAHPLPDVIIMRMERDLSVFLIIYGIFMAFIAVFTETSTWLFFKTGGFYIITIIFFVVEMLLVRMSLRKQ